jgi:excisionase family DNA binding protein
MSPQPSTTTSINPILVGIPEAGRLLSLSRSRIFELISERKIKSVKDGRRRLIVVASLHDFAASLATQNVSANGGWTVV